jgi:hypothetical protein
MRIKIFSVGLAILIFCFLLHGQTIASSDRIEQQTDLVTEYSKHMGFSNKQVLDVSIAEGVMRVSINECSFCGVLKNDKKRSELANKTLDWFLQKTGLKKGTVEWYNKSQVRIMIISGTGTQAEITSGHSCAIK